MPKEIVLKRTANGYQFIGGYQMAALISTQLNTPAIQSKVNRHFFTVNIREEYFQRLRGVLAIAGVQTLRVWTLHNLSNTYNLNPNETQEK